MGKGSKLLINTLLTVFLLALLILPISALGLLNPQGNIKSNPEQVLSKQDVRTEEETGTRPPTTEEVIEYFINNVTEESSDTIESSESVVEEEVVDPEIVENSAE